MVKSAKSFVKTRYRLQIALFFLSYPYLILPNSPTPLLINDPPFFWDPRVHVIRRSDRF